MFSFFSAFISDFFSSPPSEDKLKELARSEAGPEIDRCVIKIRQSDTHNYHPYGTNRVGDVYDIDGNFVGNIRFNSN